MAEGNFFNFYFNNSNSMGEFEAFDSENSFIMTLNL